MNNGIRTKRSSRKLVVMRSEHFDNGVSGFRSSSPSDDCSYRGNTSRKRRFESSRTTSTATTTNWVWRLLAASLVAASHRKSAAVPSGGQQQPRNRLAIPVWACDAFVPPTKQTNPVSLRPERGTIRETPKVLQIIENESDSPATAGSRLKTIPTAKHRMGASSNSNHNDGMDVSGSISTKNKNNNNRSNTEVTGLILAVAIILSLAGMSGTGGDLMGEGAMDVTSSSVAVVTKVVENTVPTTSTEVVAVTLGESIGGVIGAIISVAINFVLRGGGDDKRDERSRSESSSPDIATPNINRRKQSSSLLSQGLSDGDYFIANSASYSILEAVGVPESIAKYGSIFIAAIPSQLVKIGSNLSEQRRAKEDELLNQLLREEKQRSQKKQFGMFSSEQTPSQTTGARSVDPKKLVPLAMAEVATAATASALSSESAMASSVLEVDFVEVFADVTRWLEYDVLKSEYGEMASSLLWMGNNHAPINNFQASITYSLLGSLAAVSSRWYADILYGRFCYGPVEKQQEVRSRSDAEWFSLYSSTAASAAALFGCYEFFQLPIGRYIQGTLAGGVEGCVGSSSFNACMQTFIDTNSPGPTPEAQLRALITNLYAVYVRLQDIAGDTSWDDVAVLVRAWSVSFASYLANLQ